MKIIKLIKEELMEKVKGKLVTAKTPDGDIQYVRHDVLGLLGLLAKFDTRLHTLKELKAWTGMRDKLRQALYEESETLEISEDDSKFLVDFLSTMKDKDAKDRPLSEFEVKTLIGISDELSPEKVDKVQEEKVK